MKILRECLRPTAMGESCKTANAIPPDPDIPDVIFGSLKPAVAYVVAVTRFGRQTAAKDCGQAAMYCFIYNLLITR
jgi:hypothetical protein